MVPIVNLCEQHDSADSNEAIDDDDVLCSSFSIVLIYFNEVNEFSKVAFSFERLAHFCWSSLFLISASNEFFVKSAMLFRRFEIMLASGVGEIGVV